VAAFALSHLQAQPVAADATADSDLFALTNQDRTSNGFAALADDSALDSLAEAAPYNGCSGAGTIYGRAQDMINRDYFSHQIPPCEEYVWPMMSAFGVAFESAGENVGWESGYGGGSASAEQVNTDFMNSPDHRANILNPSYTALGIGSATTASGQSWTYPGAPQSYQGVWMFAEEFAQLASASTPPPTAPPTAPPTPTATATPGTRPTTPATTPASSPTAPATPTATAAPAPTPSTTPTASPTPASAPGLPLPAYENQGQGLISDTILSTLEGFLFN
jgi:uncharacterized protein YkwD